MLNMESSIIGSYNERLVSLPSRFPQATITPCIVQRFPVKERDGRTSHVLGLLTSSGVIYEIGRMIKSAIYGAVYVGSQLIDSDGLFFERSRLIAIKRISKEKVCQLINITEENPIKEIDALQFIGRHKNVIHQIECVMDDQNYYSILEFVKGGELFDHIDNVGRLTESQARKIFKDILDGTEFLHSKGVCHRDLSLENILITQEGHAIIIDFGMTLLLSLCDEDHTTCHYTPHRGRCGKKNYMDPNVFRNEFFFDGFALDLWAIGIILFTLVTSYPPFVIASPLDNNFRFIVQEKRLKEALTLWGVTISDELLDLLERMLQENAADRLTLQDIRDHPWMHFVESG